MSECAICGTNLWSGGFGLAMIRREGAFYRPCDECFSMVEFTPTDADRERAVVVAAEHCAIEKFEAATPEIQAGIRLILGINVNHDGT